MSERWGRWTDTSIQGMVQRADQVRTRRFLILSWLAIVAGVVTMMWVGLRGPGRPLQPSPSEDLPPEEILRRRYAAGEIETREFHHRLSVLWQVT